MRDGLVKGHVKFGAKLVAEREMAPRLAQISLLVTRQWLALNISKGNIPQTSLSHFRHFVSLGAWLSR